MPTAIVTGASGTIGGDVTKYLLDRCWEVLAHYCTQPGPRSDAVWWRADFTGVGPEFDLLPHREKISALIHCAGTATLSRCEDSFLDDWENAMAVNVIAPAMLTSHLLPALRATGGHVIYVNSIAGLKAPAGWAPYAASKHAAKAWMDALRQEEPDIRCSSIFPGDTDSPTQRAIVRQEGGIYEPQAYMTATSVARTIIRVLDSPMDIQPSDIVLEPSGL